MTQQNNDKRKELRQISFIHEHDTLHNLYPIHGYNSTYNHPYTSTYNHHSTKPITIARTRYSKGIFSTSLFLKIFSLLRASSTNNLLCSQCLTKLAPTCCGSLELSIPWLSESIGACSIHSKNPQSVVLHLWQPKKVYVDFRWSLSGILDAYWSIWAIFKNLKNDITTKKQIKTIIPQITAQK